MFCFSQEIFLLDQLLYIYPINWISICVFPSFFLFSDLPLGSEPTLERRPVFPQHRGVSPPGPKRQRGHAVPQDDPRLHLLIHVKKEQNVQTCAEPVGLAAWPVTLLRRCALSWSLIDASSCFAGQLESRGCFVFGIELCFLQDFIAVCIERFLLFICYSFLIYYLNFIWNSF